LKFVDAPAFKEGTAQFASGQEIQLLFDSLIEPNESGLPGRYDGSVCHSGPIGKRRYEEKFVLGLGIYIESLETERDMHDLVLGVRKLRREMAKRAKSGSSVDPRQNDNGSTGMAKSAPPEDASAWAIGGPKIR
jgi:hypothetical protein